MSKGTIGLGLSLGDHYYPEPYFYISPYPQPKAAALPPLAGNAHWHTKEFTSAALPASKITEPSQVSAYVNSAIAACSEPIEEHA